MIECIGFAREFSVWRRSPIAVLNCPDRSEPTPNTERLPPVRPFLRTHHQGALKSRTTGRASKPSLAQSTVSIRPGPKPSRKFLTRSPPSPRRARNTPENQTRGPSRVFIILSRFRARLSTRSASSPPACAMLTSRHPGRVPAFTHTTEAQNSRNAHGKRYDEATHVSLFRYWIHAAT